MPTVHTFLLLLVTALALAPQLHQRFIPHVYYSKVLSLRFSYGCPQQVPLPDCHFSIQWNGKTVQHFSPKDYGLHSQTISVKGNYGENMVKFLCNGKSVSHGVGISNVTLGRTIYQRHLPARHEQLLLNSQFIQPINNSTGWVGSSFIIRQSESLNQQWPKGTRFCELPSGAFIAQSAYFGWKRKTITQTQFHTLKQQEKVFILSFDYAAQQKTALSDNRFQVLWNSKPLQQFTPQDFKVHKARIMVRPLPVQKNTLTFESLSTNPSAGSSFHKVYLGRRFSLFVGHQPQVIRNGWFERDRFAISQEETIFDSGMEGWQGKMINIGTSSQLNPLYDSKTVKHFPVCHLTANSRVSQEITFDSELKVVALLHKDKKELTLGFSYAAAPGTLLTENRFVVLFNGETVAEMTPPDFKKHYAIFRVVGRTGKNTLTFAGRSSLESKGVGISYVTLKRINRKIIPFNLIANKVFTEPTDKNCSSKGWHAQGKVSVLKGKQYAHRWDWDGKGCVCPLPAHLAINYDFDLSSIYEYVDPRAKKVPASKRKTLKLLIGYYPQGGSPLPDSKFTIEWNGKVVREVIPKNYYQSHLVLYLTARVGPNTLKIEGTGATPGKGGAFNYIRLLRSSYYLQPHIIAKMTVPRRLYRGGCPKKIYSVWKGDTLTITRGKTLNRKALFSDCVLRLMRGQKIMRELTFDENYQNV